MGWQEGFEISVQSAIQEIIDRLGISSTLNGFKACNVATTENIILSGNSQLIDGQSISDGQRVLVKDQNISSENGIYIVSSGSWLRTEEMKNGETLSVGSVVFVSQGDTNANSGWILDSSVEISVGSDPMLWTSFTSGGGGGIVGTIAANEIAFGTGIDSIGGDSRFTWNPGTGELALESTTAGAIVSVSNFFDGNFLTITPTSLELALIDPITSTNATTINPTDVAVGDGSQSGNVKVGEVSATDNASTNSVALKIPSGVATLISEDSSNVAKPLNLSIGELQINADSGVSGQILQSNGPGLAPTWENSSGGIVAFTDEYHVDGVLGSDITGTGSMSAPYKTIQACLNAIGMPVSKQDACRKIKVFIHSNNSSAPQIISSQANNFDGIYQEGTLANPLWVPPRIITFYGPGVKIGNAGDASGYGYILNEVSTGRRFGASSSEVRHTMTFQGTANSRDSHQRIRNGIHIGAGTRVAVVKRNIDTIQGDSSGANDRVNITLKSGQFPYDPSVSPQAAWSITLNGVSSTIIYSSPNPITNSTSANQGIFFRNLSGISGLSVDVVYYVINATPTTFQVSTSVSGPAVIFSGTGTGTVCGRSNTSASAQLPFEPLIRFVVSGTTNYNAVYDIIEKISTTSFVARRVTGTNTSSSLETPISASFYETDTTGGSGQVTKDIVFDNAYQQGTLSSDDGTNNGGAQHAGGIVVYLKDSRLFGGMLLPTNGTNQRWENTQINFAANVGATVTAYSRTTNVVTVTTSADYAWATGMIITITSSSSSGGQNIDGTWTLTGGNFGTMTFAQTGSDYGSQTPTATSPVSAASNVGSVLTWDRCSFSGTASVNAFTYSTDDMGITDCRWNSGSKMHIISTAVAPQVRMDDYSANSFNTNGTWSLPVTFTDAGDTVTRTAHALWNGAAVSFSNITSTTGISVNTTYYVIGVTANTFQIALTPGGSAIALTTNGSGIMEVNPSQYSGNIDILTPIQQVHSLIWVQNTNNTIANDNTEKTLLSAGTGTLQLPANFFKLGRSIRIGGYGYFSATASPTIIFRIKFTTLAGVSTTMLATAVVTSSNETNALWSIESDIVCQTVGSSGKFFCQGIVRELGTTSINLPMVNTSQITLSTSVAYTVNVTAQWGTAALGNTITLTNLTIIG